MVIDSESLNILQDGFSTVFLDAYRGAPSDYKQVATIVYSNSSTTDYSWLGSFPQLREWIGNRQIEDFKAYTYTLTKKNWESTISVDRDEILHDNLGIVKPRIENLALAVNRHYERLIFDLMKENGKCYDGENFFSKSHKVGKPEVKNEIKTFSNLGDKELSADSLFEAMDIMQSYESDNGNPIDIRPDLLVVSPENRRKAMEILNRGTDASGADNIAYQLTKLLVTPYLKGADWYLFDTSDSLKPFILQINKEAEFVAKESNNDDRAFMRREYLYGVDAEHTAGYGLWQLAYKSEVNSSKSVKSKTV